MYEHVFINILYIIIVYIMYTIVYNKFTNFLFNN